MGSGPSCHHSRHGAPRGCGNGAASPAVCCNWAARDAAEAKDCTGKEAANPPGRGPAPHLGSQGSIIFWSPQGRSLGPIWGSPPQSVQEALAEPGRRKGEPPGETKPVVVPTLEERPNATRSVAYPDVVTSMHVPKGKPSHLQGRPKGIAHLVATGIGKGAGRPA